MTVTGSHCVTYSILEFGILTKTTLGKMAAKRPLVSVSLQDYFLRIEKGPTKIPSIFQVPSVTGSPCVTCIVFYSILENCILTKTTFGKMAAKRPLMEISLRGFVLWLADGLIWSSSKFQIRSFTRKASVT